MKLEAELLPHKDLKPLYGKAIWVYVYQTFKQDEADRVAERMAIRFGVTSWPQLILANPITFQPLAHAGRSTAAFRSAFAKASLFKASNRGSDRADAIDRAFWSEAVAKEVFEKRDVEHASKVVRGNDPLGVWDIVPRTRAAQVLAEKKPAVLVQHAAELLRTPSDAFRYLICQTLGKAGDVAAAPHLEALVTTPTPSRNPNVLRIRAVQALATCGRPASVKVVAPYAASGVYFNGLTGVVVTTLAALATTYPATKPEVERVLRSGYPSLAKIDQATPRGKRALRSATGLAKRIHRALADPRPFPVPYDEAGRATLMQPLAPGTGGAAK